MRKRLLSLLLGILSLSCSSCVEFARQDLWFRYDQETDTLRICSLYGGIFSNGDDNEAIQQLASVMAGGRTFFFANWILEYDASEMEKHQSSSGIDTADRSVARLFLDNVSVKNGKFFLNAEGRLCGCQFVEAKNASKLIKAANALVSRKCLQGMPPQWLSKTSAKMWLKAAAEDHQWLTLDRGALIVRIPLTQDDFIKFKREAGKDMAAWKNPEWNVKWLASIIASDCWATWKDDFAVFNVGFPGQDISHLGMPVHDDAKGRPIIERVKSQYGLLDKAPDIKALSENFLKSGVVPDDAVTPPIPQKK